MTPDKAISFMVSKGLTQAQARQVVKEIQEQNAEANREQLGKRLEAAANDHHRKYMQMQARLHAEQKKKEEERRKREEAEEELKRERRKREQAEEELKRDQERKRDQE